MLYNNSHLRLWLNSHKLIKISKLEEKCKIPKDTLRHFKEDRRKLPEKYFKLVEEKLEEYGYLPSNSE